MKNETLTLFEASKALVTYMDEENVFDKAAAGGCSGMDYHLSDAFYDLIVNTRKAISEIENEMNAPAANNQNREAYTRLFAAINALTSHIKTEGAFDSVNDMGPVGIETYQSDAFIEMVQRTNKAIENAENALKATET